MASSGNGTARGMRSSACGALLAALLLCAIPFTASRAAAQSVDRFGTIDPSGEWRNETGALSLMLAGDALSFSYSAVFGASAHICDGAGVAGLVEGNIYHFVDAEGTIAFEITTDTVRMRVIDGIPSFCGAGWTGAVYLRANFHPPRRCTVTARRSRFHVVMRSPPHARTGYVVAGNILETAPAQHEDAASYVLARYRGKRATTAGLLRRRTLSCPE